MPVRKFRDISDMPDDHWYEPGDPALLRAIRACWDFARRTTQPSFPPGVYKHRSIEDAERQRERWEEQNFERFRRRRGDAG